MSKRSKKPSALSKYCAHCHAKESVVDTRLRQLRAEGKLSRQDCDILLQSRDIELRLLVVEHTLSFALAASARELMEQHGFTRIEARKVVKNYMSLEEAIAIAYERKTSEEDEMVNHQMRVYYARQRAEAAWTSEKNASPADIYLYGQRLPGHYGANQ